MEESKPESFIQKGKKDLHDGAERQKGSAEIEGHPKYGYRLQHGVLPSLLDWTFRGLPQFSLAPEKHSK